MNAHTIGDPSNRPLKLLPEDVEWSQIEEHHELTSGGERLRICHLAVVDAASVVVLERGEVSERIVERLWVSFSIMDEAEQRGLRRLRDVDGMNEGTYACWEPCAKLMRHRCLDASTFTCFADVFADAAVSILC